MSITPKYVNRLNIPFHPKNHCAYRMRIYQQNNNKAQKNDSKQSQKHEDSSTSLALSLTTEAEEEKKRIHKLRIIQKKDEKYARELQTHFEEEEIAEMMKQKEQSMYECCCCYTPVDFDEMAQCPEGHLICRNCIKNSIETALGEGRVRTECLCTDGCNCKISMNELERVLPKKLIKRLDEIEAFNAIKNVNIKGLRTCWKCGYKIIDEDNKGPFICPWCYEKTCKKCGNKYHDKKSCKKANLDPNRIVEEKMSEAIVKKCPKCNTQYIKDEGCNHMTCPLCHTDFCYLCGKIIRGKISKHYRKCTQFMDNDKYVNEQIQNARTNAMKELGLH